MLSVTDRKNLQVAIQCLELAVHPNTRDTEIIASINGWRRKTAGRSIEQICEMLYDQNQALAITLPEFREQWAAKIAAKQERITLLTGENINLRRDLEEARRMVVTMRNDNRILQGRLTKKEPNAPIAVEPPPPPPAPEPAVRLAAAKTPVVYPVQYTSLLSAQYGDEVWVNASWNSLRLNLIRRLTTEGLTFQQINKTIAAIIKGKRATGNYKYDEALDLSVKTRSATEVCMELARTALAQNVYCEVQINWPKAVKDQAKKTYPDGLAFPGARGTLVLHDPAAPESRPQEPAPSQ